MTASFARRRSAWVLGSALFISYAYFYQAGGWNQNSRFALVRAILERHTLQIDAYSLHTGDRALWQDHYYSDKAPGVSLLAVVPVQLARAIARSAGVDPASYPGIAWTSYVATIVTSAAFTVVAALGVLWLALRWGHSTGAAVFAATAYGVATPAWCYATLFMGHGTTAGCLMAAYAAAIALDEAEAKRQERLAWVIGLASGWAVVSEFQAAVPAVLIAGLALLTVRHGDPRRVPAVGARLVAAGAMAAAVLLLYNFLAFGSPVHLGYASEEGFEQLKQGLFGITFPTWPRLREILFGSYRGLLPIAPLVALMPIGLVILGRAPKRRGAILVAGAIGAYYVLLNASYFYWEGGWAYGPRQLMPGLPFLAIGLAPLWDSWRRGGRAVLTAGWVWGAALTLIAVSTTPQPPASVKAPVQELLWPAFRDGDLSLNHQTFVTFRGDPELLRGNKVPHASWNLGEIAGLRGRASLLPLGIVWAAAAAALLWWPDGGRHRRAGGHCGVRNAARQHDGSHAGRVRPPLVMPLSLPVLPNGPRRSTVHVPAAKPVVWLLALFGMLVALVVARAALQVTQGLHGEYFLGASSPPVLTVVTPEISTAQMTTDWNLSPPPVFRARWFGYLTLGRSGLYTFATSSDDGSTLAIDGKTVVDNAGVHGLQTQTGQVRLEPGPHFVVIEYVQAGGDYEMSWSWAREGDELSRVPAWVLSPGRVSYTRALVANVLDRLTLAVLILFGLAVSWLAVKQGRLAALRAQAALRLHPVVMRPDVARAAAGARRLSAMVVGIAGAIVVSECGARVVLQRVSSIGDPGSQHARAGGPHVSVNSLGFREREIGPKALARYRIAVIGDSYTWGQGLEEDERFSNVLEELLGPDYEVLNFGRQGNRMPDHLSELDEVLKVSPGFVLLQIYINDFETSNMRRPQTFPLLPAAWNGRLVESSIVYRLLSDRWAQFQEAVGLVDSYDRYMARHLRDPDSPDARQSSGELRRFFERARAVRVPSGAVVFPEADAMGAFGTNYPFGFLHDRVRAICADEHVSCLDLLPSFSALPDPRSTWVGPSDPHPNAQTNRRAAFEILGTFGSVWRRSGPEQNQNWK